jgi:ABC-type nitrate/sulfonate/bicarbonate transport system substrate-binding protein
LTATASGHDKVKLAIGQRGNWDTSVSEIGQLAGIFGKHDLELEMIYTNGAGETQQAVISGSVDIGIAAGVMGVLSAYSKGAPVRVIGAETTGANDLYWYVKADSPIKSLKDTERVLDARHRYGLHEAISAQGNADRDGRAGCKPDSGHVRANRCRLGGSAVRAGSA